MRKCSRKSKSDWLETLIYTGDFQARRGRRKKPRIGEREMGDNRKVIHFLFTCPYNEDFCCFVFFFLLFKCT